MVRSGAPQFRSDDEFVTFDGVGAGKPNCDSNSDSVENLFRSVRFVIAAEPMFLDHYPWFAAFSVS